MNARDSIAASLKKGDDYATTISWIRAKVSFDVLRSALLSQRNQEKEKSSQYI